MQLCAGGPTFRGHDLAFQIRRERLMSGKKRSLMARAAEKASGIWLARPLQNDYPLGAQERLGCPAAWLRAATKGGGIYAGGLEGR